MEIKKLTPNDLTRFIELIKVFEVVFEMENFQMPPREHLAKLLAKPDFMVFVVIQDNVVIAGLTIYTLEQYYATKPLAYIYDLAVKTSLQRQGIGQRLIKAVNTHCKDLGYEEVFVQADKVDDYALDFYRKTKPTEEEDVSHFYYNLGND